MKRLIRVELLEIHPKATFYVVRFKDDPASEFEKFIDAYSGRDEFQANIKELVYWMDTIGKQGAEERYFRLEGGKVKAIPVQRSRLRLYCYRVSEMYLIWSGGGHKTTQTFEEDQHLDLQVKIIRSVGDELMARLKKGICKIGDHELNGNLEFEIEI